MNEAFESSKALLGNPGVVGVFRSSKRRRSGKWIPERCITVGVLNKKPIDEIPLDERVPSQIEGILTDVIELRPKLSLYSPVYLPICGGISIGNTISESAGTLGGIFWDNANQCLCGLTNFHVAAAGDTPMVPDAYIVHPSGDDDGLMDSTQRIGKTTRYAINEYADACIFTLTKDSVLSILGSHAVLPSAGNPDLGDVLEKVGRSTGTTQGEVTYSGLVIVDYSEYGYDSITMEMVGISPLEDPDETIVDGGDSGSVWYDSTTFEAKALHTAHMTDPMLALACLMPNVLSQLNCSVVPPIFRELVASGSFSVGIPLEHSATGSFNIVKGENVLATKIFAVDDWERTYSEANFEQWCQDLGYEDEAEFLADWDYETRAEWFEAELSSLYETLDDFLAEQTLQSVKNIMATNGVDL